MPQLNAPATRRPRLRPAVTRVLTALTLAAALAAPRSATAGAGVTAGPGRWFKDAGGRTLILRGVNIAADAKLPNFQPVTDLAALDALPARGVSVARLLFTWEAYEPAPGAYDGAYMAYIKSIVAHLHSLGVLTIVDMHQDAYARSLGKGCGDGFPGWAVPAAAAAARSLQPTPPPAANTAANAGTKRCASWLLAALLDVPTGMAWKGFYEDEGGARSAFVAVWARVAAALASEPGLLGYDLLNEPALSEAVDVAPLYADVAAAVRAVDPTATLFLSAALSSSGGLPTWLPDLGLPNAALAVHFYPPPHTPSAAGVADAWVALTAWTAQAAERGVPLFVGEYGAEPTADAPPLVSAAAYVAGVGAALNKLLLGGAQWAWTAAWTPARGDGWNGESYSVVDAAGAPRPNWPVVPYPPATAGTPVSFDAKDGGGVAYVWDGDVAASPQTTTVFAPAAYFGAPSPADVVIETLPTVLACSYDGTTVTCGACAGRCEVRAAGAALTAAAATIGPLATFWCALLVMLALTHLAAAPARADAARATAVLRHERARAAAALAEVRGEQRAALAAVAEVERAVAARGARVG